MTTIGRESGMSIKDYDYVRPSVRTSPRPSRFWPGIVAVGAPLVVAAWAIAAAYLGIEQGVSILVACVVPALAPVVVSTFGVGSIGRWSALAALSGAVAALVLALGWGEGSEILDSPALGPLVSALAVGLAAFGSQCLGCLLAAGIARSDG